MSQFVTQTLPAMRGQEMTKQLTQILGGALLLALCAQIKIVLPWTPIPLTAQTLTVLLLGGVFGSRMGAWMVMAYLGQILIGLPVLSGGESNPMVFLGPKGGYLVGFVVQAYLMGWFMERMTFRSYPVSIFLAACTACLVQLLCGSCWLTHFVGWKSVWMMGFYPFILGEIFKSLAVVPLIKRYRD